MIEKDNTKRFWDKIADETKLGDRTSVGMLADVDNFNSIYRKRIEEEHFLRLARLTKSSKVLELGCGGGRWAFFIGQYVSSVTAVDFSPSMINLAKEEQRARKIDNIQFETSDIENFKTDAKFDIIYFSGVLQYLNDSEVSNCLKKYRAHLNTGGSIISRDTVNIKNREELTGEYPVIYRTEHEQNALFNSNKLSCEYSSLAYPPRRFSRIISKIYGTKIVNYKAAFLLQSILIKINNLLGNPRVLMSKEYQKMTTSSGIREHKFFVYSNKPD